MNSETGPPTGGPPGSGGPPDDGTRRYALLYPFKPGRAAESDAMFAAAGRPQHQASGSTRLLATTVFRRDDIVIRAFEIRGDLDEAIEHMVEGAVLHDLGSQLTPLLEDGIDISDADGLRTFFKAQMMEVITDRVVPNRNG